MSTSRRAPGDRSGSVIGAEEDALDALLREAHLAAAAELPQLLNAHGHAVGAGDVVAYLADLQQNVLVPFSGPAGPNPEAHVEVLGVDSTLAGRVYQLVEPLLQDQGGSGDEARLWLPLVDGTERLGVLAVSVPDVASLDAFGGALRRRLQRLAAIAGELIVTKTSYGDSLVRLRRTAPMGLAAEMQWGMLPPLTMSTRDVIVTGGLEPAYEVAGDSFDYAVDEAIARFAVFDGMGHGLGSAQLATLTVAAYRNGRRRGRSLSGTAREVDDAVGTLLEAQAFCTGILAELDLEAGMLTWVNAGHPSPLLMRSGRLVKELHLDPGLPFGLNASLEVEDTFSVGRESLEPEDILLLYSDGVTEARSPTGEFFGADRLVDLVARHMAAQLPAPETMRRTIRALLEHQQAQLDDDATLMFVQWRPQRPEAAVPEMG